MPHLTLAFPFEVSMTSLLGGQVGRPSGLASSLTLLSSVSQTSVFVSIREGAFALLQRS